jgi:hypothetical protein
MFFFRHVCVYGVHIFSFYLCLYCLFYLCLHVCVYHWFEYEHAGLDCVKWLYYYVKWVFYVKWLYYQWLLIYIDFSFSFLLVLLRLLQWVPKAHSSQSFLKLLSVFCLAFCFAWYVTTFNMIFGFFCHCWPK